MILFVSTTFVDVSEPCPVSMENQSVMSVSVGVFMKSFMTLNIINFANVVRREKDRVLWNVRRVSSL